MLVIIGRRVKWKKHVALMGEVRNQYKIPGGKCRKKKEFH
jgi:hypothetical protein